MYPNVDELIPKELKDRLIQEQKDLSDQVLIEPFDGEVQYIAGCDSSFLRGGEYILSVFVILSYPELELVECQHHVSEVDMPYIPGLLAFREMPNVIKAYEQLEHEPDLIFVDGHGLSHPRKMGIATHLGVTIDKPTIGVAKKRLVGKYEEPGEDVGDVSELIRSKQVIGKVLRNKKKTNPLFVSVGHRITLDQALAWVQQTTTKYRLPQPTHIADAQSKSLKKEVELPS